MSKIKREWREALVMSCEAETSLAILRKKNCMDERDPIFVMFATANPFHCHVEPSRDISEY